MKKLLFIVLCILVAAGCAGPDDSIDIPSEEDDLVASFDKEDTGYLSDQATEIEGTFTGFMDLDLSAMTVEERDSYVDSLRSGGWKLRSLVGDHIKYGKNQLNTEKLHINLSAQNIGHHEVTLNDTTARVVYSLSIETIVSFEELEEAGIDPNTLTNRAFPVRLPGDPRDLFDRIGDKCAEGHDEGSLANYNYFYYFKPGKQGCDMQIVDATFTLHSLLPQKTTYPEYHRLVEDKKVTVAVFFGAAGHEEEVSYWDEGMREHREFVSALKSRGFSKTEDLDPKGERYVRHRAGLEEIVDVVSPEDLHALKHDSDGLFVEAVKTHEIIIYDGHSFYGSLSVLDDKNVYPPDTYQILFMNSCWSYEYYTKQVFEHKAGPDDPTGWALADVVNNTEAGWFLNMGEETRILLTNLFAGCETGGREGSRQYTWDAIIEAMNKHALERWRSWNLKSHEIYGVSGVRTNCYDPENPDSCNGQGGGGEGESHTYESTETIAIPDNDEAGITSTINVPDSIDFNGLTVFVDVEHTFIGDLVVELTHAGKTVTLQSREGGAADNIQKEYTPIGFTGTASAGDWVLKISDRAGRDTGSLKTWSITLTADPDAVDPITYENTTAAAIPDNDETGVESQVEVTEDRPIGSLVVTVDITHTYIGDLVIELSHNDKIVTLQDQEGGSAANLQKEFRPADFTGDSTLGTWTLKVSDRANLDSGTLNSWSITFGG